MNKNCAHLCFGDNNYVELATLTTTPASVTNVNLVKNTERAEVLRFKDFSDEFVEIEGTFDEPIFAEYLAIVGTNLRPDAEVEIELYATLTSTTNLNDQDNLTVSAPKPLGEYRAGIDPYNELSNNYSSNHILWFNKFIEVQRFKIRIKHRIGVVQPAVVTTQPTEPNEPEIIVTTTTEEVSDGIVRQEDDGTISIEAENGEIVDAGLDSWIPQTDSNSSGGTKLYKQGGEFYSNPNDGPRAHYRFTSVFTGTHDVWTRLESTDGNSIYCIYEGNNKTNIYSVSGSQNIRNVGHVWRKLRSIYIVADQELVVTIAARDHYISFDKVVILPVGSPAPTGEGPSESPFGTKTVVTTTTTEVGGGTEPVEVVSDLILSNDSVDITSIVLGNLIKMDENFSYGGELRLLTEPEIEQLESGYYVTTDFQQEVKMLTLNFDAMTEVDRLVLSRMEVRLKGRPFLVTAYPGKAQWFQDDYVFFGIFSNALAYRHFFEGIHQTTTTIVEV